jgi:hypothetical protein
MPGAYRDYGSAHADPSRDQVISMHFWRPFRHPLQERPTITSEALSEIPHLFYSEELIAVASVQLSLRHVLMMFSPACDGATDEEVQSAMGSRTEGRSHPRYYELSAKENVRDRLATNPNCCER